MSTARQSQQSPLRRIVMPQKKHVPTFTKETVANQSRRPHEQNFKCSRRIFDNWPSRGGRVLKTSYTYLLMLVFRARVKKQMKKAKTSQRNCNILPKNLCHALAHTHTHTDTLSVAHCTYACLAHWAYEQRVDKQKSKIGDQQK